MKYNILGKKIASTSIGSDEITIGFEDDVILTLKAKSHVTLGIDGILRVRSSIQISTDKVKLEA